MKKTLLFFLLLFTTIFYAQVSDIEHCAGDTSFDLTSKKALLIGNLDPALTTVSYHLSLTDAQNNLNAITSPTNYISVASSTTIYARIDNNGTVSTNSFNLKVYQQLDLLFTVTSISCYGANNGTAHMISSGGKAPYVYSLDGGSFIAYSGNSVIFTNLSTGIHRIDVKDALGCIARYVIQIMTPLPLIPSATVTEGANCGDKDVVTLTATGGQQPYSYSFNGVTFSDVNTFNNLKAGAQTLFVKDSNGCVASTTATVNNYKSTLTSTVVIQSLSCSSIGSITVQGIGGKSPYQYSLNGLPFQTNNVFNNLLAGTYTINTKDDLGCEDLVYATISQYSPMAVAVLKTDVSCYGDNNGSIEVNTSGGNFPYTYSLRDNNGLIINNQTSNIFRNLVAGDYIVEAIDASGCFTSYQIFITEPTFLISTVTVENQTITVNATGGNGIYNYSNGNGYQTSNIFTNVSFGNYQIYVRDQNGCVVLSYVTVDPPAPLIDDKNTLTIEFTPGQTLGDLLVNGQNIKWYSTKTTPTAKTNKAAETTLPSTTALVNGTTYYASQTINGIESKERLAVTAKAKGTLSTPDFVLPDFKYYPNPVQHTLTINNSAPIDEIEIFSVSGKSILTKKINNTNSEIDLSNVASGFYFLKVKAEGQTKTIKIVKK